MLVTVLGAARLGQLRGLTVGDDTGLLRATADAGNPGGHVLVLAPTHATAAAREQAHVLIAAHRDVKVCVLPLDHHALTLTLIAYDVVSGTGTEGDPSQVVLQIMRSAAASRSLLWYPRLWGLDEPSPSLGQGLTDLFRRTGWFLELGRAPEITSGRKASPFGSADVVHHLAGAPALLKSQLGDARALEVPLDVERAPYWARNTTELSVLRPAVRPQQPLAPCRDCGAGLIDQLCPFCGQGPATSTPAPLRQPSPVSAEAGPPSGYLARSSAATRSASTAPRPLAPVGPAGANLDQGVHE